MKAIAFYLPGFHTIPENDKWWGEGFTEWTNVRRAKPRFRDHYQPHIPLDDLGYYDLRDALIRQRQADLAREYGIYGFCYYYYWFNGKRLLEYPLNEVLKSKKPDFPFCICWANENWTRKWDGQDKEILIEQRFDINDGEAIIYDLIPFFLDDRYIRISGKPVFIIYRPNKIPGLSSVVARWRDICHKKGIGDIFLCCINSSDMKYDPRVFGFDAGIEFPPHNLYESVIHEGFKKDILTFQPGIFFDYRKAIEIAYAYIKKKPDYTFFRTVMPSWDNTARYRDEPGVYVYSTPDKYREWLEFVCAYTKTFNDIDKHFIFINAWNEWGEGCHLEPDSRFGYEYLRITKSVLDSSLSPEKIFYERLQDSLEKMGLKEKQLNDDIKQSNIKISEMRVIISQKDAELQFIRKTILWKISVKIYNFFDNYIPKFSQRRFFIIYFLRCAKKIIRFLKKIKEGGSDIMYPSKISKIHTDKKNNIISSEQIFSRIKQRRNEFLRRKRRKFNRIAICQNSRGSYFFHEISELLACGFKETGYSVEFCDQGMNFNKKVDWYVIVAPFEFFYDNTLGTLKPRKIPENIILLMTAQPHSFWFDACEKLLFKDAFAIWSIEYATYGLIKNKYTYASYMPLGYSEKSGLCREISLLRNTQATCFLDASIKRFSYTCHTWRERPIDITIFCQLTKRRNVFFARNAHVFSKYRCYFIFVDPNDGFVVASNTMLLDTDTVLGIMQRSKIMLNIHRGAVQYFEWHRMVMHAIWNKTLVITEKSNEAPPFQDGRDYVSCTLEEIGEKIEFFLSKSGEDSANKIISNAYRTLTKECRISEYIGKNMNALFMKEDSYE